MILSDQASLVSSYALIIKTTLPLEKLSMILNEA
jgi:hypothetical protein